MARQLRIQFPGAIYHITSRGNRREPIYETDTDRSGFLELLSRTCEQHQWVCHAYCLMDNHYHLVIETVEPNLSKGMRKLNGVYTQSFNRAHERVGHVFQGRYKAILVDRDQYLLELCRYVVLNPLRANMVRAAKDWPWSSYRATAGINDPINCLSIDWLLSHFGKTKKRAFIAYRAFVTQGKGLPPIWSKLRNQVFLGDEQFVERMQMQSDNDKDLSEIPRAQRRPVEKSLSYYRDNTTTRNDAIQAAYATGAYSMKAIGDYFGLHFSTISGIVNNHKK